MSDSNRIAGWLFRARFDRSTIGVLCNAKLPLKPHVTGALNR